MQAEANTTLMDELAEAKQGGAIGMMKLIYKKMQNAVYARYVMNWKKNRSCTILEGKIDGGGLAFLEDAKRKERERQQEEEAKIRAERLRRQREKEKRDAGLRMMRRTKARWEGDVRAHVASDLVRNFRDWHNNQNCEAVRRAEAKVMSLNSELSQLRVQFESIDKTTIINTSNTVQSTLRKSPSQLSLLRL